MHDVDQVHRRRDDRAQPPLRIPPVIRVALVCSPDAGAGLGEEQVSELLRRRGARVEIFKRDSLDASTRAGADRLVVSGGDGSVAPAAHAAARAQIPLAIIPTGTANNFARAEGIPSDVEEACRVAVESERIRALELGYAGERPFVNLASAGLAPVAADWAARWKKRLGPAAYAVGAVAAAATTTPIRCRVTGDGRQAFDGRTWQVMVASSGAFGPGTQIETADTADGSLDLVVVPARRRAELVRRGWWAMRGQIASQPGTVTARAHELEVDVPEGTRFNIDGEVVTLGPARFTIQPRAFRLVTP